VTTSEKKSKTLIFMSADIAGATNFKQTISVEGEGTAWLSPFETFFREFPLVLMGRVAVAFGDADYVPDIGVWKVIGDEIVFRAQPKSAEDALGITEAFYRAIVTYDARFFERWPLRIRGTCWAGSFPGRNIEVEIPEMEGDIGSQSSAYVDYLGPDVDTGFRITKHGESGNVIISVNLAEALAEITESNNLRFHYAGTAVLKGVFGGRPYPLILISFADLMPDLWRWEVEESRPIKSIRDDPPMDPQELIKLSQRIRTYLNRTCRLGLAKLDFG
jgi:hypothetical protein